MTVASVDRLERRLVERGGEQPAPQGDPGPGQVGVARACRCLAARVERRARVLGLGGVGDAALGHRADRVLGQVRRGRRVGHQATTGESGSSSGMTTLRPCSVSGAVEPQHDDLARAGVTADPDLGVDPRLAALVADDDGDDAARVLAAGVVGGLDGLLGVLLVDDDEQGQHAAEGHRPGVLAQGDQLLADRRRCVVLGQVDDHGILQTRPSRRIISSAPAGPQPPDT